MELRDFKNFFCSFESKLECAFLSQKKQGGEEKLKFDGTPVWHFFSRNTLKYLPTQAH